MCEVDNIELWDDWYLEFLLKKILKEIERRKKGDVN